MIKHAKDLETKVFDSPEIKNASMKVLVDPSMGWDSHVMRLMEVGVNGYTPKHAHPWPHINYMVEGEGVLMIDGVDTPVSAGSHAYVPGDTIHQFRNVGNTPFKFLCIVPTDGHTY